MTDAEATAEVEAEEHRRRRWLWKSLPWGLHTTCTVCTEVRYCHGKTRERMVCLECFSTDLRVARLRRGGQAGPRSTYSYRRRRPQLKMITVVAEMAAEGLVAGAIADILGISEKTVRNYLSRAKTPKNRPADPHEHSHLFPRKEEPDLLPVAASRDATADA